MAHVMKRAARADDTPGNLRPDIRVGIDAPASRRQRRQAGYVRRAGEQLWQVGPFSLDERPGRAAQDLRR